MLTEGTPETHYVISPANRIANTLKLNLGFSLTSFSIYTYDSLYNTDGIVTYPYLEYT